MKWYLPPIFSKIWKKYKFLESNNNIEMAQYWTLSSTHWTLKHLALMNWHSFLIRLRFLIIFFSKIWRKYKFLTDFLKAIITLKWHSTELYPLHKIKLEFAFSSCSFAQWLCGLWLRSILRMQHCEQIKLNVIYCPKVSCLIVGIV